MEKPMNSDADRAARAPADSVTVPAGGAEEVDKALNDYAQAFMARAMGWTRELGDAMPDARTKLYSAISSYARGLSTTSPTPQAASSAVLKAIRAANMQLVRTGDDEFMLVTYKNAKAQCDGGKCGIGGYCDDCPPPQADSQPAATGRIAELEDVLSSCLQLVNQLNEHHIPDGCSRLIRHIKDAAATVSKAQARAPAGSVTAPAGGIVAGPTSAHIAAMERAWLWMENQADSQSKGGHATFDLLMLREERDALRAAIDMEVTATCPHCNGTGEVFGHAQNCTDDLCALNGDEHSCAGRVEHCQCAAAPTPPATPSAASIAWNALRDLTDPLGEAGLAEGSADRAQADSVTAPAGPSKSLPYEPTSAMLIAARERDPALPIETVRAIYWSMWRTAPTPPAQAADSVLEDAARYHYLRDVPMAEWPDELVTAFRLQQNAIWDAAIDAARKQGGA